MAGAIWTRCRTCWTDGVAYQCKNCPANNSIKDRFKVIRTEAKELYAPVDIEVHKGLVGSASLLLLKGYLFVKISIKYLLYQQHQYSVNRFFVFMLMLSFGLTSFVF